MDYSDYYEADRETQDWLRDLDNFGKPPPPKHLSNKTSVTLDTTLSGTSTPVAQPSRNGTLTPAGMPPASVSPAPGVEDGYASAQELTPYSSAYDIDPTDLVHSEEFMDKVRLFQKSGAHPYANKTRVETTKKIAAEGGTKGSAGLLIADGKDSTQNPDSGDFKFPTKIGGSSGGISEETKTRITKAEIEALTDSVKKTNRPVNPWADPQHPPTKNYQLPISVGVPAIGMSSSSANTADTHPSSGASSSAYSSYSSVGGGDLDHHRQPEHQKMNGYGSSPQNSSSAQKHYTTTTQQQIYRVNGTERNTDGMRALEISKGGPRNSQNGPPPPGIAQPQPEVYSAKKAMKSLRDQAPSPITDDPDYEKLFDDFDRDLARFSRRSQSPPFSSSYETERHPSRELPPPVPPPPPTRNSSSGYHQRNSFEHGTPPGPVHPAKRHQQHQSRTSSRNSSDFPPMPPNQEQLLAQQKSPGGQSGGGWGTPYSSRSTPARPSYLPFDSEDSPVSESRPQSIGSNSGFPAWRQQEGGGGGGGGGGGRGKTDLKPTTPSNSALTLSTRHHPSSDSHKPSPVQHRSQSLASAKGSHRPMGYNGAPPVPVYPSAPPAELDSAISSFERTLRRSLQDITAASQNAYSPNERQSRSQTAKRDNSAENRRRAGGPTVPPKNTEITRHMKRDVIVDRIPPGELAMPSPPMFRKNFKGPRPHPEYVTAHWNRDSDQSGNPKTGLYRRNASPNSQQTYRIQTIDAMQQQSPGSKPTSAQTTPGAIASSASTTVSPASSSVSSLPAKPSPAGGYLEKSGQSAQKNHLTNGGSLPPMGGANSLTGTPVPWRPPSSSSQEPGRPVLSHSLNQVKGHIASPGESMAPLAKAEDGLLQIKATQSATISKRSTSQEALESQQRRYEKLQDEVAAEMDNDTSDYGICHQCQDTVRDPTDATQALGNLYHSKCFTCTQCGRALKGKKFYEASGKIYCEEDYLYSGFQQSSERCAVCGHFIMEMILQAVGLSFHPQCFRCSACKECLDGVPFTVDSSGKVYCVQDYHRLFAPKCAKCNKAITPISGTDETVRVVAMNRDYHIECYVCEGCGLQLTDESEKRCYPLGEHLLCQECHIHWSRTGGTDQPITDL